MRQIGTHLLTLLLGAGIAVGIQQVLVSQDDPEVLEVQPDPEETTDLVFPAKATESFVNQAVEGTGDAVVQIDTARLVNRQVDPLFRPYLREIPQEEIQGQGSGFIIERNGIILTNAHVVSEADRVTVTLKDGRTFDGEVLGADEITDLAVVKINGEDLPVAPLGDSDSVSVGDWAIAVGNPVGLDNTVTLGIISTLDRASSEVGIPDKRVSFLQTDAAINPGNSGGPLLNQNGEVIGINTAIRANAMGIGFAIPINKAKELKDFLISGEQVPHPYVGIQMITLTPELAQKNNQDPTSPIVIPETEGVLVVEVLRNTPAATAGIRQGDVIVEIEGERLQNVQQLQEIIEESGVNEPLQFTILRGSRPIELTVTTAQLRDGF
ncbi:MAG: HhoA/HhoB/HtrA family serine endopeptidase [Chroococcales cyanobacterium]